MSRYDACAVSLVDAGETELPLGGVALPAHHPGDEDADDPRTELVVKGDGEPQAGRKGTHPLADGDEGDDVIDESRRARNHPAAATARAQHPSPARQADDPLEITRRTLLSRESPFQPSATGQTFELPPHEPRQRPVGSFY